MIKKFIEKIKIHFKQILDSKTTPHEIALGFSIGTAIAILPTFGLGALIGILIAMIYKKISKVSLFLSFAFWNPIFLAPLAGLSYLIGDFVFNDYPLTFFKFKFLNQIFVYTLRYFLGNFILVIFFTIMSYIIILYIAKKYQGKRTTMDQDII